jgi:hypothetical protein
MARRRMAQAQIESRVESQTGESIDEKTREAVDQVQRQMWDRFTREFDKVGVAVTPIEMKTTSERLVARLRVAGEGQPASHTPRPRALSDSLASVQLHETALTNAATTLELDGNRFTAPELQALVREKFAGSASRKAIARPETTFKFTASDAVQFRIDDGRLEVIVALAAVELDGRTMRDFAVHAFYRPAVEGLSAELVRDGGLGIEGRLSSADRARLHNVFNEVFSPERPLPVVRLADPADRRFEGLMITQLVLEDGWLGLAVGPASRERVAERWRSLR